MVGTSVWDYVFIRGCIFLLHLVAPLSTAHSLVGLFIHLPYQLPRPLQIWLGLEAAFYLFVYFPRRAYLQNSAKYPMTGSRESRRRLFQRCHDNIPDPNRYLEKWFLGAPAAEIKRENVKDFFRWAFLDMADSTPEYEEELEEYVGELEGLLGRKLEPGRGSSKPMRLTVDKVDMLQRSLVWYFCVFVVDTLTWAYMRYHSFDFYRTSLRRFFTVFPFRPLTLLTGHSSPADVLTYWHRPHTSKTRLPVLFLHGIGIGLYPNVDFLADLNSTDGKHPSDGQVGIIAIEVLSISSRITSEAMLKDEICREIDCILKAHGWEKVALVSHSYGSVIAAHLLHNPSLEPRIGPLLFIDPVVFLLHLPDVAYNFVYRKPARANEYQLSYFGSKDMGTSHTLFRRFLWADNILWKEDLRGHQATVVLAGKDAIVDTGVVAAYLTGGDDWIVTAAGWEENVHKRDGLDVVWFQDLDHGQVFDRPETRRKLVESVRGFSQEG